MKHIYDYLTEYAIKEPKKTAIADEFGGYTYAGLDKKSSAIAVKLQKMGIKCGDAVAVYTPYVKELVLGTFAVMRAGGVYVPLEYSYPDDRLLFMLSNSSSEALLTLRSFWENRSLDFPKDRVIFMDDEYEETASVSADMKENDPAMILYTSGTTGVPKGVVIPQIMMVNLMNWAFIHEGTKLTEDSRAGIMSGLTFSATTLILYSPFMYGGTVILAPEKDRRDMDRLYTFLKENKITHTFLPAGLATTIVEHYDMSGINIFAGGEKLRNFHPMGEDTRIINTYGCTELGAVISALIKGDEDIIPVGFLSPDCETMIVDDKLSSCDIGETGELLIATDRMARSYLGLMEQTKAKWIDIDGKVYYRTGDRARVNEEGLYFILGRTDNMIKIRGFRVETGEVEAQIARACEKLGIFIKNSTVVVRNVNGIDHLTCYYESPSEADAELITKEISASLASYMVPDIWVRLDAMPRNLNGKIMRSKLPQPKSRVSAPGSVYSEAESRVVETVAYVLGINGYISPDDGFASLGGTSLKAMELAAELRNVGIDISASRILKLDSLRIIAKDANIKYDRFWSIEEYERIRSDFALRGEKIEKVLPITPEQDEALFELLIHPDRRGNRHVFMLQVDSVLSEGELRSALSTAALKYEQLRSAIVYHKTNVIQQVITNRKIPIEMISVADNETEALKDIYSRLMQRPCDLERESSVQVVCAVSKNESFLFILDFMSEADMCSTRKYIACIMNALSDFHPEDKSVLEWKNIFEMSFENKKTDKEERNIKACLKQENEFEDIHVYSDESEKKIVFVHTGNTGSEAYYNLAERIKGDFSFAVIEPFNLYHPEEAEYGISNIAARYIRTLKKYQPEGPYIIGGWCYGGIVAQEMACRLKEAGEEVTLLVMLDSHAITDDEMREVARAMHSGITRDYFETGDLFEDMRNHGMLDALVVNSSHVGYDMVNHVPSFYDGPCLYFKPRVIPKDATGLTKEYWERMMSEFDAGGYENYCNADKLTVIKTDHEHDLMMDAESLDIIVPRLYEHLFDSKY